MKAFAPLVALGAPAVVVLLPVPVLYGLLLLPVAVEVELSVIETEPPVACPGARLTGAFAAAAA